MEAMGLKLILVAVRHLLGPISMFGLWLALLGLIASSNSPNRGYNLPILPNQPPHLLLPAYLLTCDITVVMRKLFKFQQC